MKAFWSWSSPLGNYNILFLSKKFLSLKNQVLPICEDEFDIVTSIGLDNSDSFFIFSTFSKISFGSTMCLWFPKGLRPGNKYINLQIFRALNDDVLHSKIIFIKTFQIGCTWYNFDCVRINFQNSRLFLREYHWSMHSIYRLNQVCSRRRYGRSFQSKLKYDTEKLNHEVTL